MKRILGILAFAMLVNSCDDGDLVVENIDFSKVDAQSCTTNNLIYKIKNKESLLLDIPKSNFVSEPTPEAKPILLDITTTNRVIYRFYNGVVAQTNVCDIIPPALPNVSDQWTGIDGKIQIKTTAIKEINDIQNSSKITGYNHNIIFKNITFQKVNGTQKYETFPFGDYIQPITPLPFDFKTTLEKCTSNDIVYKYNNSESFTLIIDPTLLNTTTLGTTKKGVISATKNILTYRLYTNGVLTPSYFCNTTEPTLPTVSQEWKGANGVPDQSGIIEVVSTTYGTGFKHTITLKKVTFQKGANNFKLGDSYLYGELITSN
jgi:hypothetical protein